MTWCTYHSETSQYHTAVLQKFHGVTQLASNVQGSADAEVSSKDRFSGIFCGIHLIVASHMPVVQRQNDESGRSPKAW